MRRTSQSGKSNNSMYSNLEWLSRSADLELYQQFRVLLGIDNAGAERPACRDFVCRDLDLTRRDLGMWW